MFVSFVLQKKCVNICIPNHITKPNQKKNRKNPISFVCFKLILALFANNFFLHNNNKKNV